MRIKITLRQLEILLEEQKKKVIERVSQHTYLYNKESTEGELKSLPIDKDKLREHAMGASFPDEFNVLKKYIDEL